MTLSSNSPTRPIPPIPRSPLFARPIFSPARPAASARSNNTCAAFCSMPGYLYICVCCVCLSVYRTPTR